MPAVAITDHGNLYAAVEFYQNALALQGVKPIHRLRDLSGASGSLHGQKGGARALERKHILPLLAKNEAGWNNLVKLVSIGHLEGDYLGEPRVDREHLQPSTAEGSHLPQWLHQRCAQ